jgi:hypothetical protein
LIAVFATCGFIPWKLGSSDGAYLSLSRWCFISDNAPKDKLPAVFETLDS